jgi:hypothetical protein
MNVKVNTGNILAKWDVNLPLRILPLLSHREESFGVFRQGPSLGLALGGEAVVIIHAWIRTQSVQISPLKFEVSVDANAGIAYNVIASIIPATKIKVFPPVQLGTPLLKKRMMKKKANEIRRR